MLGYTSTNNETGQGGFIAGLLWGAAIGAAAGIMFAPRAGAETRRTLAQSGERLRQGARQTLGEAADTVSGVVSQGRKAVERGFEAFDQARTELSDTLTSQADARPLDRPVVSPRILS